MKKQTGLFIVIDGTDGSGKATQSDLLIKRLRKEGYRTEKIDFPQYGKKSAGLVEEYLNGKYGSAEEVGPFRASIFFACDRYATSAKIKKWLGDGRIVICDRYVTANMGHQGGKIKRRAERNEYFKWLYELEYKIFEIPKPDFNLILHVDAASAQRLINPQKNLGYRNDGKKDIHEKDLKHLRDAERSYLEIARTFPEMKIIECMENGKIMTKEKIHGFIWKEVYKNLMKKRI